MSEASEAGEASGVSETIEARRRRCRSNAWCKGGRCTAESVGVGEGTRAIKNESDDGRWEMGDGRWSVLFRQAIK